MMNNKRKPLIDESLTDVPTLNEKPADDAKMRNDQVDMCQNCGEVHDGDICPSQY